MSARADLKTYRKLKADVERERRDVEVKERIVEILRPFTNKKRAAIVIAAAAFLDVEV